MKNRIDNRDTVTGRGRTARVVGTPANEGGELRRLLRSFMRRHEGSTTPTRTPRHD